MPEVSARVEQDPNVGAEVKVDEEVCLVEVSELVSAGPVERSRGRVRPGRGVERVRVRESDLFKDQIWGKDVSRDEMI